MADALQPSGKCVDSFDVPLLFRSSMQVVIAPLVIMAAVLTACSSAPSTTPSTSVRRNLGCTLLSTSQAEGLMGGHVTIYTRHSECDYILKPGTYLAVSAGPASNAAPSLTSLIDRYSHFPGNSVLQVADHTALWITYPTDALGGGRLQAVDDGNLIYVTVTQGGPDPMPTAVQAMTEIINARLSKS